MGITNGLIFHVTIMNISKERQSLLPSKTLQRKSHFTTLVCVYQFAKNLVITRATKVEQTYAIGDLTSSGDVVETQGKPDTFTSFVLCTLFQLRKTRFSLLIVIRTLFRSCKLSYRN